MAHNLELTNARCDRLGTDKVIYVAPGRAFGTDAVLLADFAAPRPRDRALDLCTGCGIIPLLWALEGRGESIVGLELDRELCGLAAKSAEQDGFSDKLSFVNADLRELKRSLRSESFDIVACNPPYFPPESGFRSPDAARDTARSESTCSLEDACTAAAFAVRFGGRVCMCHRAERLPDVISAFRGARLEPKRLRLVQDTWDKGAWLLLIEGRKGGRPGLELLPALIMKNPDGTRTPELERIYGKYGEGVK